MVETSLIGYIFYILIPFISLWILNLIWIILVFKFRHKVMKIRPDLALQFLSPTFNSGSKSFWHILSFGALSKRRTEKLFDELFRIKEIKKLNNKELNKTIERMFKLYKVVGLSFWLLIPLTLLWILLPVFIRNITSWLFG